MDAEHAAAYVLGYVNFFSRGAELQTPIEHPAAWRGEQLLHRTDWLQQLSPDEVDELSQLFASPRGEATIVGTRLSKRFAQIQHDLEHGSGACLLRGAELDGVTQQQAEASFERLTEIIGTPVSQSADGATVFHVRDEGFTVGHPQARGPNTKKRLSFHTDRCDVIAFLCLRQARSGGENQLVSSMAVYNEMLRRRPDLVEVLMRPFYYRRHNVDTGNERPWCRQPIFSFCQGHFAASYLRVLIDRAYELPELPGMSDIEREALDYLEELAAEPELHVRFRLERGDMLFLNNWVTLHRRDEFVDHDDPALRRHLLRVWLSVPNSRPIDPQFADNFGATAAGALRGGMRPKTG